MKKKCKEYKTIIKKKIQKKEEKNHNIFKAKKSLKKTEEKKNNK